MQPTKSFGKILQISSMVSRIIILYSLNTTSIFPPFPGKFIEDITRRVNIKFYNDFEGMEACLKNHVESMPKIINENLVQVFYTDLIYSHSCLYRWKSDRERHSLTSPFTLVSVSLKGGNHNSIIKCLAFNILCIISKLIMAEFWYNTLTPVFGSENIRLIYTGEIRY